MSFASEIKKDLCRIKFENLITQKAELSGIIRSNGQIHILGAGKTDLTIKSENPAVARLIFTLVKNCFKINTKIETKNNFRNHRKHSYSIKISGATKILVDLMILDDSKGYYEIIEDVKKEYLKDKNVLRAYIRGVFLAVGSINNPKKEYHLELNLHSKLYAESLNKLLHSFDLNSKIIERKNNYVIYIKESNNIADFLGLIGAHKAVLEFENVRTMKQVRNSVNRLVNCETANLTKTVNAAYRHIAVIEKIRKIKGIDFLEMDLQELALLRLANPEASLSELAQLYSEDISKSSINYKLKKIEKIAKNLEE